MTRKFLYEFNISEGYVHLWLDDMIYVQYLKIINVYAWHLIDLINKIDNDCV